VYEPSAHWPLTQLWFEGQSEGLVARHVEFVRQVGSALELVYISPISPDLQVQLAIKLSAERTHDP
jgi:hypothetical protein